VAVAGLVVVIVVAAAVVSFVLRILVICVSRNIFLVLVF